MSDPIWLPCAAMVGLTAAVWVKLYADRLGEMRAKRIDPQALASARATAQLERPQAAENFRNLFEVPVLFYVLCVALVLNGGSTPGFVMAAWGKSLGAIGKIRMLGDGSAELTQKLGLAREIPGMGVRCQRFSMLIDQGVVQKVNVEEAGQFGVSSAATMLEQLG